MKQTHLMTHLTEPDYDHHLLYIETDFRPRMARIRESALPVDEQTDSHHYDRRLKAGFRLLKRSEQ